MSSRHARERREQLTEFKERDAEYKETDSKEAAIQRSRCIEKLSPEDGLRALETLHGRNVDEKRRRDDLLRKVGFTGFTKRED